MQPIGKAISVLLGIAVVAIIVAAVNCLFVEDSSRRFFQGYLVAFAFVMSISLGSLFFVLVQHLMRAGLATLLLSVLILKRFKLVPAVFSDELQRDLGRLLFAFVFFWAYIGFSQYMLLWYANMPETTGWMVNRGMSTAKGYQNSWGWLAIFLLFAHFIVPFCGIMSRHMKSHSNAMAGWAIWLLVVHYLDLYWIVIPENNTGFTMSLIELGTAVAVIAVYGSAAIWIASKNNLFAAGDPRMPESLTRHAMY